MHEGNIQSSETERVSSSLWRDAWIKLSKNRLAIFGLFILLILILVSLLTPIIAPYGYEEQNLALGATAPRLLTFWGLIFLGETC